jgi:hypothetical protein
MRLVRPSPPALARCICTPTTGTAAKRPKPKHARRPCRRCAAACPAVPASLSTSSATEPDPECRLALIVGWTELPDLVNANQGEEGHHRAISRASRESRRNRSGPTLPAGRGWTDAAASGSHPAAGPRPADRLRMGLGWQHLCSRLLDQASPSGTAAASSTELGPLAPRLDSP